MKFANDNFSLNDLVTVANFLSINHNDEKDSLIKNICLALMDLQVLSESFQGDDDEENFDEDLESENSADDDRQENSQEMGSMFSSAFPLANQHQQLASNAKPPHTPAFSISFRDVEGSIKPFDGSSKYSVEKWIADFEGFIKLLGWSELHAFIFAKKSLTGIAKLFVESESGINSWQS